MTRDYREYAKSRIEYLLKICKLDERDKEALEAAIQALSQEPFDDGNNLCSSCTNIGCEFQSGIVRTKCAFYMPPRIEPDNCGNYVVVQPTAEANNALNMCDDAISRDAVDKYIARLLSGYLYDGERERLEIFSAYLWELPSVTHKSGKWIEKEDDWEVRFCCCRCGKLAYRRTDYCPNCGARMESEE